jgi:hypothetical protein
MQYLSTHIWNLDKVKPRQEELDGRSYIVVPMTMILEGVHAGSEGSLFYSKDELSKTPCMWNMKPITVEHPYKGVSATDIDVFKKQAVGLIMHTRWVDGKLKAEAWIDSEKAKAKEPRILEHIEADEPMELSTGLFADCLLETGKWKKEDYTAVAKNIRADHLALLPDKSGACSVADGAGLLINQAHVVTENVQNIVTENVQSADTENGSEPENEVGDSAENVQNVATENNQDTESIETKIYTKLLEKIKESFMPTQNTVNTVAVDNASTATKPKNVNESTDAISTVAALSKTVDGGSPIPPKDEHVPAQISFDELRQKLEAAAKTGLRMSNENAYFNVCDIFDTFVIISIDAPRSCKAALYKIPYKLNGGVVQYTGTPIPVKRRSVYKTADGVVLNETQSINVSNTENNLGIIEVVDAGDDSPVVQPPITPANKRIGRNELVSKLNQLIVDTFNATVSDTEDKSNTRFYIYIREIYDAFCIADVSSNNSNTHTLYKISYKVTGTNVKIVGKPEVVTEHIVYETFDGVVLNQSAGEGIKTQTGELADVIREMLANEFKKYDEVLRVLNASLPRLETFKKYADLTDAQKKKIEESLLAYRKAILKLTDQLYEKAGRDQRNKLTPEQVKEVKEIKAEITKIRSVAMEYVRGAKAAGMSVEKFGFTNVQNIP